MQLETTCLDNEHEENVSQISQLCSVTFLLLPLGFPVREKQQVLFALSSSHLKVSLHLQAHLGHR